MCGVGAEGACETPFRTDGVGEAGEFDKGPSVAEVGALLVEEVDVMQVVFLGHVGKVVAIAAQNGHCGVSGVCKHGFAISST